MLQLLYMLVFSPVLTYFTIRANHSEGFLIAHVGLKPENWRPMQDLISANESIQAVGIKHESAVFRLDYTNWASWLTIPIVLHTLLSFTGKLVILFISYQLIKIFAHLHQAAIFHPLNVRRIRLISFSLFLFPIVTAANEVILKSYLAENIHISGYELNASFSLWSIEYYWFFMAALVYILAEIFNAGVQLQQEKDLTI